MAIGEIVGDLATMYLTPAQRAAQALKSSGGSGVVGRAQQQLPTAAGLASFTPGGQAQGASSVAPQTANLSSLSPGATTLKAAAPATAEKPLNLSSLAPTGVLPTANSPTYPAPAQQRAMDLRDMGPADTPLPAPTANLESMYRPTGIGQGSNAIVGRVGADGVAEFSNAKPDLASAAGLASLNTAPQPGQGAAPLSLADLAPGGRANPGANAGFASLGLARNLGDGVGTFSQSAPGDSALALSRFGRANEIRRAGAEQDSLDLANARNLQANQLGVVRDSSQPVTRSEVAAAGLERQNRLNLADAANFAQGVVNNRRTGQSADRQERQAMRLEDILTAGTAPNATPEQRAAAQRAQDPDGSKALARQLTQSQIDEKQASTTKTRAETAALGTAGPKLTEGQSKDLNYFGRGNVANGRLETQGDALTAGASGERGSWRGRADAIIRGIPVLGDSALANTVVSSERQLAEQSGREFVSAILRKDSGAALTKEEMDTYGRTYLPQPGDSDDTLKQKHEARTQALQGIRDGLGTAQILAAPVAKPAATPTTAQPRPPASAPAVGTIQQGYVFLGGDPASQANWRAQ